MSRHHHLTQPLNAAPGFDGNLPPNTYGALVGSVDGPLGDQNSHHVFIMIRVQSGEHAGLYQAAVNVDSEDPTTDSQYFIRDEAITADDVPPEGFDPDAQLSYAALGLVQDDFTTANAGNLRTLVHSAVLTSTSISVYGFTYSDGTGIHDVHMNSGEPQGSSHPSLTNQDGALACYRTQGDGTLVRRWVFVKFSSQRLP